MFFSKKRQEDLETYRDITDDVEESDFVPYSCLYNDHTVLTKNGELLQTIAVTGPLLAQLQEADAMHNLRNAIRAAFKKYIVSDCYAIWVHTVRREENYTTPNTQSHPFAQRTQQAWEEQNQFAKQFTNEVFISIVREGHDADIIGIKDFMRGLIPSRDVKWHNEHLDKLYLELNGVVDNIIKALAAFGSRKLGIYLENGVYYSDSCAFLEKIINLVDRKMPVTDIDLAHYLTTSEITFSFNAMEVRRSDGRRRFASILTVKEYKEKSLPVMDTFLKAPIEFIATQCVDFINPEKALAQYKKQKHLTTLSGDESLAELTELDAILASDNGNACDFGQQQLSIFLLADSVRQLETYTRRALNFMAKSGIIAIREDIHFEECYWAQLPGNFEFIRRLVPTNTSHVGGFTNVTRYPTGKKTGNHWGDAITTLYSHTTVPYYFNFHEGENGHTLIAGSTHTRRREVLLFLLAMSMKHNPKIHVVSVHKDLERMTNALDGKTLSYNPQNAEAGLAHFNPFWLKNTPENISFLANWMLMYSAFNGRQADENLKNIILESLQTIAPNWANNTISNLIAEITTRLPEMAAIYAPLLPQGDLGNIFHGASNTPPSADMIIHDLSSVANYNTIFAPFISLLLQYISENLTGEPTIIVLDDGLEWLRYTSLGSFTEAWLTSLSRKNAMCIFLSNAGNFHQNNPFTATTVPLFATRIFMTNPSGLGAYPPNFGVNELEQEYIDAMDPHGLQFIIKKPHESVVSGLELGQKCAFIKETFKEPIMPMNATNQPILGGVQWSAESLNITSAGKVT
jgi:type IV secretion system protein VirB4